MCRVYLCVSAIELRIKRKHPNYWELQKIITFCQILQCGSKKGAMVLSQTCEAICRQLRCVGFCALPICGGDVLSIFQFVQSICTQGFISQVQFGTWVLLEI